MARPLRRPGNLPAETTSFVGRRRELGEIRRKLAAARLVTLVGPGGVGKTRLAVRAATDLARGFHDGAWLVELAEVRDAPLVDKTVLTALGFRDQATAEPVQLVLAHLRERQLLLVMDNCEHLLEPVSRLLNQVIRSAPGVRVLATSREPLGISGEQVVAVPPLELPAADPNEALEELRQNEAIALFLERAAAAAGEVELTAFNRGSLVGLIRRLDGLPLAIELAAVRTRVLSVEEIRERLSDRFVLLTGGARGALPRHQTLRATIDWSHDLLTSDERALLRRISVFGGRFTLEDVEGVCAFDLMPAIAVLDLLTSLVDKSLVVRQDAGGRASFRLHETMREYAALKLREAGEVEEVGRRCIGYYRDRCARWGQEVRYQLPEWLEWMDLEIDNIRAVLRHCLTRGEEFTGLAIAVSLSWYWITRATSEGVRWFDELLFTERGSLEMKGWAFFLRGFLSLLNAEPTTARPALRRAVGIARETGQQSLLAHSLAMASVTENLSGDRVAATHLIDQARAATRDLEDVTGVLSLRQAEAMDGLFAGDVALIRRAAQEGDRLARASGDVYDLAMMLMNRSVGELFAGDHDAARPLLAEALRLAARIDDRVGQAYDLSGFAYLAACEGQARLAARLLGAGENMRTTAGAQLFPFFEPFLSRARDLAVTALGPARFEAEFAAGARYRREAAVALALGETATPTVRQAADSPLAGRELEIGRLLAEGLSNKEIAAHLFISRHTVDSHVRGIFSKLGVNSRAQVAARLAATPIASS